MDFLTKKKWYTFVGPEIFEMFMSPCEVHSFVMERTPQPKIVKETDTNKIVWTTDGKGELNE